MSAAVKLWDEDDERRHREFMAWVSTPLYRPDVETYPLHQMGPDGKRKARHLKVKERKAA